MTWLIYWGKKNKLQWTCSLKEKSLLKNLQTQLWVKQPLASSIAFSVQQLSGAKEQRLKVSFCRHWVEVFGGILSECVPTCGRLCVAVYFRLAASLDWSVAHRSSSFWLWNDGGLTIHLETPSEVPSSSIISIVTSFQTSVSSAVEGLNPGTCSWLVILEVLAYCLIVGLTGIGKQLNVYVINKKKCNCKRSTVNSKNVKNHRNSYLHRMMSLSTLYIRICSFDLTRRDLSLWGSLSLWRRNVNQSENIYMVTLIQQDALFPVHFNLTLALSCLQFTLEL